jgi:arylamine N-acetyltransferase
MVDREKGLPLSAYMTTTRTEPAVTEVATEYFSRVNYTGSADPNLETLHALVSAHTRCIAFENIDPLLGRPIVDLDADTLVDKLVRRRRGGYCYEHNGLMGYVLEELGFTVDRISARVVWPDGADIPPPPENHNALVVAVPGVGGRFLVDVGFGGPTPTAPLRCTTGTVQQTPHGAYKLLKHGEGYLLHAEVRDQWQPLYVFTTRPRPRIDLEVGSWYMSTYPRSILVTGLMAAIVTDYERYNLRGRNLTVHRRMGTERIRLDSAADVLDLLTGRFGIGITDLGDRTALQARVSRVLDA